MTYREIAEQEAEQRFPLPKDKDLKTAWLQGVLFGINLQKIRIIPYLSEESGRVAALTNTIQNAK